MTRLLAAILLLTSVAAAQSQHKPAPRISETVARESFVLMQFIQTHGRDADYDDFIGQQIDRMRTFNTRKADQDMIAILESYAGAESLIGLTRTINMDGKLKLGEMVSGCSAAVRESIVGRHVVRAKVCDAANTALDKAVTDALHPPISTPDESELSNTELLAKHLRDCRTSNIAHVSLPADCHIAETPEESQRALDSK